MELLTPAIGWSSLVLGILVILVGIVTAWNLRNVRPPEPKKKEITEQGFTDIVKDTTEFAKALKDLDRSMQLILVGVVLFGIAALVAGLDTVATAIETAAGQ